jgi:NitT/TauT family transport system ATP-binding protein
MAVTTGLGLELQGVSKRFGATAALDGIDLVIPPGQFLTLIGPSGCGKTTLLRLVAGLAEPDDGTVTVGDRAPRAAQTARQLGFVPQSPGLLPWRTVRANARLLVDSGRRRAGLPPAEIDALLARVGLEGFLRSYPHELSGGMQQRVALVRAFALDAPVLLMDEPFAALDEITRAEMRYLLLELAEERQATVLFVTHSIAEAVMLSDRVVVMTGRPGRIEADREIPLSRPRHPEQEETAEFFALVVFFGAWELLVRVFDVRTFVLLRPSTIFSELLHNPGFYWRNTLVTAKEALLGYLVALAVALLWGAIMARSRFLEQASTPVAVLIQVTPIVAYAPSAVLWLGRGLKPIVFITGLICLVPLLFAVTTGLRSADPAALDLMAVVDAPGWEVVRRVRLPYALPYLFSATRTCVGLALIGAVLAEWYALVDQGLGRRIQEAIDFNQSRQLWASIYAVALLGGLAIVLLNVLERRLLHWHASTRTVR